MSGTVKAGIENDAGNKTISADELTGSLSVSGSTSFFNSSNTIRLPNIGNFGLAVGDVITVTGTSSNNKDFTVEVISDINNIIVNQAHANGTTTKSLVNETVSATVTLLSRAKNAPIGLGQGWVQPSRAAATNYTNNTNRAFALNAYIDQSGSGFAILDLDSVTHAKFQQSGASGDGNLQEIIPVEVLYKITLSGNTINNWFELR